MKIKSLILFFLLLTGCNIMRKTSSMSVYVSPHIDQYQVQKVLVFPLKYSVSVENIDLLLHEGLQKAQRFEVVSSPEELERNFPEASYHVVGTPISSVLLVQLAKYFGVQAIMRGRVTHQTLTPPRLGIKLELISTYNGEIIWAVDAIFYEPDFYATNYRGIEHSVMTLSYTTFARGACMRVAETLSPTPILPRHYLPDVEKIKYSLKMPY